MWRYSKLYTDGEVPCYILNPSIQPIYSMRRILEYINFSRGDDIIYHLKR